MANEVNHLLLVHSEDTLEDFWLVLSTNKVTQCSLVSSDLNLKAQQEAGRTARTDRAMKHYRDLG